MLSANRLCVVAHALHPEHFDEILRALQALGPPLRLIVTTEQDTVAQIQSVLDRRSMRAEIEVLVSRGGDILPFLSSPIV